MARRFMVMSAVCVALMAAPAAGWCAAAASEAPAKIAAGFFATLKRGQTKEAFDGLFAGTEVVAMKSAEIGILVSQVDTALKYYGAVQEPEFISEDDLGAAVLRQTYVLRTERGPLFWKIYFYKRGGAWTVNTVDFDDNIRSAFK